MKIGIVSQSYYPRFGGVTEHVHHTALELRRRGHEVRVITSRFRRGETNGDTFVDRIGTNVLVPFNGAFVDLTIGVRLRQQLDALLRVHEFDLLHTHAPLVPTLPLLAVKTACCAQVGTFHTTGSPSRLLEWMRGYLAPVVEKLDARIAVSETARDFTATYFPGEYHVIPNGVDVEQFHPAVVPFEALRTAGVVNILFVGRLDPRKGVDVLLAALPELVERTGGRARLLIVGDSYLRPKLEASVPGRLKDHVRFLGHVPVAELPRWYATGDIFVSPALGRESFGIVLLEAMACGRAVVASDIPGYRSVLVPGVNGIGVPPGDPTALAQALAALAADEPRRRALGIEGRARALEFAWPRVTDRIEAVYRDALHRRGAVVSAA